jgi:hypothetical protein
MPVRLDSLLHVDFGVVDRFFRVSGDAVEDLGGRRCWWVENCVGGVDGQTRAKGLSGKWPDQTIGVDGRGCVRGRIERPVCRGTHDVSNRVTNILCRP